MIKDWGERVDKIIADTGSLVSSPKDYRQWLLSKKDLGNLFDSVMYYKAYKIFKRIGNPNKELDYFIIVFGKVGNGKSTFGANLASLIDPSFSAKRMHFSAIEYVKAFIDSQPGQCQQIDEGSLALFGRDSMTTEVKGLMKGLDITRIKRQCTIVCIPSLKDLARVVIEKRADMLIQVLPGGNYKAVFKDSAIKYVAEQLKTHSFESIKIGEEYFRHGYFTKNMGLVDRGEYMAKKIESTNNYLSSLVGDLSRETSIRPELVSVKQAATQLGMGQNTLRRMIRNNKLKKIKIGASVRIPISEINRILHNKDDLEHPLRGANIG